MKRYILTLGVIFGALTVTAQQLPQFTQYFLNDFIINPGVTGTKDAWIGQSNNRYQWVGIQDAPRTYILSANGPFSDYNMGLGGYFFSDIAGHTRRTGFAGSYAYHLKVADDIKLGMGLNFGATRWLIDGSAIQTKDTEDPAFSRGTQSTWVPDAGVGFHLYAKEFWVGISAPQIIGNKLKFFDDYTQTQARLARHYFFNAGYNYQMLDELVLQPSVFVKYIDPLPVQFDATLRVIYDDFIWAGFSYRMDDAVGVMLGVDFQNNLRFGYSYDIPTSDINPYTTGSHELMLGIRFKERD
ncbi:PorP/SprF family type IX secretion system membrane protein [Salibacter halophilus]|uniref:Type IX secretion system membrane protein PorP/SprF n=1 Tax=Salibacter halophilus TaxID=1803916 RepID=A0A6N6M577_9FLAO|nr:type IX secretion system membrane protein PorP/SprF [Salibacter halophilus]KAB1063228.1 type IX secretion system membrane protein PorP/SprF [Salibacter halophilus]